MGILLWLDVHQNSTESNRHKSKGKDLDYNHNRARGRDVDLNSSKPKSKDCQKVKNSEGFRGFEYAAVCIVAVGCYVNALSGDFVHDDIPAIVQNRDVTGEAPIFALFANDFWGNPIADPASHKSYRPLTTLTFRATYALVGLKSPLFHACNVLLHITASLLFTRVCLAVLEFKPQLAAFAGALFAAHPVHTEAVTGIVGRADVLACVFFLSSLLAYHGKNDKTNVWSSVILAAVSMLAKETGIVVLLLNLFYDFYRSWYSIKRSVCELRWNEETLWFCRRSAKVLVSLSLLLVFRLAILQGSLPRFSNQDNPAAFHPCRHVRFLTFCYLAALNCWLLLFPATLSHDWQMGSVPLVTCIADIRNLATCLVFGCLLVLAYKTIVDFEHQRHPALVLGVLLLVLPYFPASNMAVTVGFVIAERVLYIPSVGWCLLVVYGLQLLRWRRRTAMCCTLAVLVMFCGKTIVRNKDWTSRETLVRSGLRSLPHNAKMHYNYANFLRDGGDTMSAKLHYNEALRLWPTYASAHNNLGTLMTEPAEAERHFLLAIRYSPQHVNAHYNLGQVYRKANRTVEAVRMLEKCISLDGTYTPAYLLLARLHATWGRIAAAASLLRRVHHMHPTNVDLIVEYAAFLNRQGNFPRAYELYEKALHLPGSHKGALRGAARILRARGHWSRLLQLLLRHRGHSKIFPSTAAVLALTPKVNDSWRISRRQKNSTACLPILQYGVELTRTGGSSRGSAPLPCL